MTTGPDQFDLAPYIEAVAVTLFGEPNAEMSQWPDAIRFCDNGAVSVNGLTGDWYDSENKYGGRTGDLIRIFMKINGAAAIAFAKECLQKLENGRKSNGGGQLYEIEARQPNVSRGANNFTSLDKHFAPKLRLPEAWYGKHIITRDWEVFSEVDIKESGALYYAMHPSTLPLLICYAVDDGPVQSYRPGRGEPIPEVFYTAAHDPDWFTAAHNNLFDSAIEIYQAAPRFNWPLVPIERQICTMALAQYHGFPGSLEKIANRLALPIRKDMAGKKLMRRLTRPHHRPDGTWGYVEPTSDEWVDFTEYGKTDTDLLRPVLHHFKPLPEIEQRLYQLDHKINHCGFTIDAALATQACELVKIEKARINTRLREITDGKVTAFTQLKAMATFINAHGHDITTLDKRAVATVLAGNPDPVVREVLELRQAGANTAAAKYDAVLECIGSDQRIHGLLRFYGTITGRWTSARFNVHNLPREDSKTAQAEIEAIRSGDLERVRQFGPPLDVIARAVRGLVIAPPGNFLLIGDFSMVEPRLISWYADEIWRLENFREFDRTGNPLLDPYRVLGARMNGCAVNPEDENGRQRGKTLTMAFGYGGSVKTWRKLVPDDPRTDEEIKAQEVNKFRGLHPAHTTFMLVLEQQALSCVASRTPVIGKRHSFTMDGDTLLLHLASGRALSYPNARIEVGKHGKNVVAYHDAKNDTERMWYGAWLAHLVQATARDLLANALLKLDAAGFKIVLHVHDEVVVEVDANKVDLDLFKRCMLDAPDWAAGLPLATKVRASGRYIKIEDTAVNNAAAVEPVAPRNNTAHSLHADMQIALADLVDEPVPRNGLIHCRFHDDSTPSLRIYDDHFHCFGCGAHGDLIDWLMRTEGLDRDAAVHVLDTWDGPVTHRVQPRNDENTVRALQLWDAAKPITGTLARRYLADIRRVNFDALPADIDSVLRFHPSCPFGPKTRHPCLLALMRDPISDEPTGIHRTALTPDARKIDRRMLGPSGVVKLWPAGRRLVIGEGLETVLAAATRLLYQDAMLQPAWSALSAGGIDRFPVIPGVDQLILLVDNDHNGEGQAAADTCKRRWAAAGCSGVLLIPDRPGADVAIETLEGDL